LDSTDMLYKWPSSAEHVASMALKGVGRVHAIDVNLYTHFLRLLFMVLGHFLMVPILKIYLPLSSDWKKHKDRLG